MNLIVLILFTILNGFSMTSMDSNDTLSTGREATKVLSRRKRYLIFPDGSSFQLVFCAQNMGYLQIGDIVWFGNTAALAWELPSDPNIFHLFKNEKNFYSQRREDNKNVIYLNEDGRVIATVPYRKKPLVNPAFAKRSIDHNYEKNLFTPEFITEMHKLHEKRNIFEEIQELNIEFHREGRKSLYAKLEKIFEGLGWQGKECIHKILCETAAAKNKQGTFLEEIMKATFTFPKSANTDIHEEYDKATSVSEDCAKLYSE